MLLIPGGAIVVDCFMKSLVQVKKGRIMNGRRKTMLRKPQKTKITNRSVEFLINQYLALRDEILKRMEIQNQMISLMLIASGTLISVGLQFDSTAVILAAPILAFFLAVFWANHDVRIRHIGLYIRKYIEEEFLELDKGWEGVGGTGGTKYLARNLSIFASQGVFIGVQILSVVMALLITKFSAEDIILIVLDVIVTMITFPLLRRRRVVV